MHAVTLPALEAIPGLLHGFEQRTGPPETRDSCRQRVADDLRDRGRVLFLRQVHGAVVRTAPWEGTPEGDAAVSSETGLLLAIETADCLPVFLVDRRKRVVAAIHAGWRGTAAGITAGTVRHLLAEGSRPEDLVAALGPGIGACCYEVGDEVRDAFRGARGDLFRTGETGRLHFDLRQANEEQLRSCGVSEIWSVKHCTYCSADLYHSYRREGKGSGRMANYLGWAQP